MHFLNLVILTGIQLVKDRTHIPNQKENVLKALYDETLKSIGEGEVIDGTVVSMNNREVVVNIGFKSDGVIPAAEVRYNPDLKSGDKIEVYVESQEDTSGQLVLSHKKARTLALMGKNQQCHGAGRNHQWFC
jgi:small subunit ribosomal protein S1